jgi:hypothetical protein
MELDDLKEIWKHSSTKDTAWSTAQLHEVLGGKSKTIISRIKRSMWLEIAIGGVAFAILISQIISLKQGPTWWLMISLFIFCGGASVYLFLKMRLVTTFDFSTHNLKDNLAALVCKLETYLKIYKIGNQCGLVIFYFLGLLVVYLERGGQVFAYITSWKGATFLVLYTVWLLGFMLIVDRLVYKMYGKHVNRLKQLLADFDKSVEE